MEVLVNGTAGSNGARTDERPDDASSNSREAVMKKATVGLAAVGAVVGIRRAKRVGQKMREHCGQMAAQCKQMAAQVGGRGEAVGKT